MRPIRYDHACHYGIAVFTSRAEVIDYGVISLYIIVPKGLYGVREERWVFVCRFYMTFIGIQSSPWLHRKVITPKLGKPSDLIVTLFRLQFSMTMVSVRRVLWSLEGNDEALL